jgi:hypothetical protein
MIQSGDDDWIINSIPSGRRSNPLDGYGTYYEARIERTETFLFGGLSPPNKKITSLRLRTGALRRTGASSASLR